ncbi:hypothetical protein ACFQ0G_47370 [Streptomyces chiangmaiensis]
MTKAQKASFSSELRGGRQQPFLVELGRGDLEHGHDLTNGGRPVGDEAVVGLIQGLLDAYAGVAEDFDDGPGPEGAFQRLHVVDRQTLGVWGGGLAPALGAAAGGAASASFNTSELSESLPVTTRDVA